jgi:NADH-quinone oxidoreductase subunit G
VGTEVPDADGAARLAGLEIVAQAFNEDALARAAALVLPAAPPSEADGTFVNFEGRAQRFERAYAPRGEARPHWALAGELGAALGLARAHATARDAFRALAPRLGDALGAFDWDALPAAGRPGTVPLAAGTVDGRLAGYRERVAPEVDDERRAQARLP